jgi:ribosomal protein S21
MLIVKLGKKVNIEKALKQMRSKVIKTKQLKKLREDRYHTKPSEKRRLKMQKAKYIQKKSDLENLD